MASRDDILIELSYLQQEFSRLARNVDQVDLSLATRSARTIADRMRTLVQNMQTNFAEDFLQNRLRNLNEDMATIAKFEQNPPTRKDLAEISAIASRFSRNLRHVESLVGLVYPKPPYSFRPMIERHGRKVLITTVAVTVLYAIFASYSAYVGKRRGLIGHYFAGRGFQAEEVVRIDPTIDLRMGRGGPFRRWRGDDFSIRWTGFIRIPFKENWQFFTVADDGVKLTIGDLLVISDWNIHAAIRQQVELKLEEGYYPITIEYFDARNVANMQLFWQIPGEAQPTVVPSRNLVPSARFLKPGVPIIEKLDFSSIVSGTAVPPAPTPTPTAPSPASKSKPSK